MAHPVFRVLITASLAVSLLGSTASAKQFRIIVNAEADEEYVKKAETLEYQTYHLVKGKFHGGSIRDRSLDKLRFDDLLQSLSQAFEKRKMYPEIDAGSGDLLIMVSWGRTSLDPERRNLLGAAGASDSHEVLHQDLQSSGVKVGPPDGISNAWTVATRVSAPLPGTIGDLKQGKRGNSERSKNMALLGFQGKLRSPDALGRSFDTDLLAALEEERYFVILNAFDYQHLLNQKELKQVWRVRYNTPAVGIGFDAAYESMNAAITSVIGLQMDNIATFRVETNGSVSTGRVEAVEMID